MCSSCNRGNGGWDEKSSAFIEPLPLSLDTLFAQPGTRPDQEGPQRRVRDGVSSNAAAEMGMDTLLKTHQLLYSKQPIAIHYIPCIYIW